MSADTDGYGHHRAGQARHAADHRTAARYPNEREAAPVGTARTNQLIGLLLFAVETVFVFVAA